MASRKRARTAKYHPTNAMRALSANYDDVVKLLTVGERGRGKRHLEVLNRAAIITICAYWEAYCEDVLAFVIGVYSVMEAPDEVHPKVQVSLIKQLMDERDERALWKLTGEGWKEQLERLSQEITESHRAVLNTPSTKNVDEMFGKYLGFRPSQYWHWKGMSAKSASAKLNQFVRLRGDIAHRGRSSTPVQTRHVVYYANFILRLAWITDAQIGRHFREHHPKTRSA